MHSMAEGFAVRRIPIRESKANSYNLPRCPLWGWCSAQRIKIAMIAGGNHTSVSCRDSGKGGVVGNFELLPFDEPHPLSQPIRAASSPIGEPSWTLRIRLGFYKTITAYRETPQSGPLGLPAPLSGEPRENMYSGRGSV